MRKPFLFIMLCLFCVVGSQGLTAAAKRPLALTKAKWELKFRFQDPQRMSVIEPGRSEPVVYWYMLYAVENVGTREVDFYPEFELVTDTLKVIRGESKVSSEAFRAVKRRAGDELLTPPEKVIGRLLCGRDRAKRSVAIWRDFDPKAKKFKIYVSGLSSEKTRLKNPVFDPAKPESKKNKRYFLLRKTLEIPYKFPGSGSLRSLAVPERVTDKQGWVMR